MIKMRATEIAAYDRSSLPALIRQAADALAGAQTAAEVLDARDKATLAYDAAKRASRMQRAKRAHDDIIAATHRAQADALEIEAAAKRRLADEYDGAQSRGEVASKGKPVNVPDGNIKATAEEIGLTRKDVFEARQVRDAIVRDPGIVRAALDELIASGDEPTRTALKRAIAPVAKSIRADEQAEKKERRGAREIELAAKQAALPTKKYGVIYADPEWKFEPYSEETGMDRAPDNHYPTSDLLTLMQRDVGAIAAKDCVLFLWATAPMLVEAICLLDAWGFAWIDRDPATGFLSPNKARCRYVSHWAWLKQKIAPGYWNRGKHEILLIATRGSPVAPAMGEQLASWQEDMAIEADATGHSKKPDVFAEWIEKHWPNTAKIELNARRGRPGWDVWGNEVDNVAMEIAPATGHPPVVAASSSVTSAELAEFKALGAIGDGVVVKGPLIDSLNERGLIWAGKELTVGGAQRLAELGRMVEAASDGDAVHVAAPPAVPASAIPADLVPAGRNMTELTIGGMRKNGDGRLTFRKTATGFLWSYYIELKGLCGSSVPFGGSPCAEFSPCLAAALSCAERTLAKWATRQDSVTTDKHRAAARGGAKWCADKLAEFGLTGEVPA